MTRITFVGHDGVRTLVDAENGESLMRAATAGNISGIVAECGGCSACATCRVNIDDAWADKVNPPAALEMSMLDELDSSRPNLRLSCQIAITPELDGMIVHVPASQR